MNNMNQVPEGIKRTAVLCVLKHGQKFLLLKRLKEPNKDNYTPVGGKLDPFETPLKAAIRETFEETGISVSAMKYCGSLVETSPTKYNWMSFVYCADIEFIPAPPCNEGTLEWIHFDKVLDIPTPKTDWFIYQYILNDQKFCFNAEFNEALELLTMIDDLTGETIY